MAPINNVASSSGDDQCAMHPDSPYRLGRALCRGLNSMSSADRLPVYRAIMAKRTQVWREVDALDVESLSNDANCTKIKLRAEASQASTEPEAYDVSLKVSYWSVHAQARYTFSHPIRLSVTRTGPTFSAAVLAHRSRSFNTDELQLFMAGLKLYHCSDTKDSAGPREKRNSGKKRRPTQCTGSFIPGMVPTSYLRYYPQR